MTSTHTSAFDLPAHLAGKAEPALIAADEQHFAAIAESLQNSIDELVTQLDAERKAPGGRGEAAMNRDLAIHRLTARLRTLRRYGLDLCLGHVVPAGGEPVYIGRLGLTDPDGRHLLVDWRAPAAEPFFAATHASPMGLISRRRYRWTNGRVTDYWDEVFAADSTDRSAALDDQSAFIASLSASREPRMRDVLATIQADQDAIIRSGSSGALVVDGGPGTGKTVVALHRAAYLLYADPRLGQHRGGILFIGPHQPYLDYVADVLPSLGEEGVKSCTLADLLPEGAAAGEEIDAGVAELKASADLVRAIDVAARFYEEPPSTPMLVMTEWDDVWLTADDWAEAFNSPDPGTPHNLARDAVWQALIAILVDKHDGEASEQEIRASLQRNRELQRTFAGAWPLLEPTDLVADLWSVPAYLRTCAPSLSRDQILRLQRDTPQAWTTSDLPLLDAARRRLGDPAASRRLRAHQAEVAAEREQMDRVIEHLIESDDSEMQVMSMLRRPDAQNTLLDRPADTSSSYEVLAGPFAHVVVDEAQELTDAQWQMVLARCPSGSLTVVGDRAQARRGFGESWSERLARIGVARLTMRSLTINYRTPQEVMDSAEPIIRAALPDANVPVSIRHSGLPVRRAQLAELDDILEEWLAAHPTGTACVIGASAVQQAVLPRPRVSLLTPELCKGLEFDLVIAVRPSSFGDGIAGAVDRYVAMTRATSQLVLLEA